MKMRDRGATFGSSSRSHSLPVGPAGFLQVSHACCSSGLLRGLRPCTATMLEVVSKKSGGGKFAKFAELTRREVACRFRSLQGGIAAAEACFT